VGAKYRYVHAPVAVAACSYCHLPHSSVSEHLLGFVGSDKKIYFDVGERLCLRCHRKKDVITEKHPIPADKPCLDCHQPHGGEDPYFLRKLPAAPG